jgi:hypothetical protein
MAGPIKVTIFMTAGKYGATESYIYNAATFVDVAGQIPKGTLGWAKNSRLADIIETRRYLSTSDVQFSKVRLTDLGTPGLSTVRYPPAPLIGKADVASEQSREWTSLLIHLETNTNRKAPKYLFGVPTYVGDADNNYVGNTGTNWADKFQLYANQLTSGQWQIQSRPLPGGGGMVAITNAAVSADGKSIEITPILAPAVIPDSKRWLVVVRGLKGPAGWNSVHEASDAGGGKMILGPGTKIRPCTPIFQNIPGQTVSLLGANFSTVTLVGPVRVVERDRGRPFDSPVGRRRAG